MKLSQFISVFEDIKELHGDLHIWQIDGLEGEVLPDKLDVELTKTLKRNEFGCSGGKSDKIKRLEVFLEYEGGVNLVDRSIQETDEF
jgi:hypothetical protein